MAERTKKNSKLEETEILKRKQKKYISPRSSEHWEKMLQTLNKIKVCGVLGGLTVPATGTNLKLGGQSISLLNAKMSTPLLKLYLKDMILKRNIQRTSMLLEIF